MKYLKKQNKDDLLTDLIEISRQQTEFIVELQMKLNNVEEEFKYLTEEMAEYRLQSQIIKDLKGK